MTIELSVIILCYKAGREIYNFVDKTISLLNNHTHSWELVLVGNYFDNSDDETVNMVRDIASKYENIQAVVLPKKGMMGWDVRSGLSKANGRYICFIDGDGQMPAEDIIKVFKKIRDEKLDFVMTYRAKRYDPFIRTAISHTYNLLTRMLFPGIAVKDINSKPKIFTREAYSKMQLKSNDWFIDAEMVIQARRLKFKIGQVPTIFYKCKRRKSFVNFGAVFEFIKNLFCARVREFFK